MSDTATSSRRAEANRRNARRSTGPRTPAGKGRSRFNAVKHGMRAQSLVLPGEDPDALKARQDAWVADLRPTGEVEHFLVSRAVQLSWQLQRGDRAMAARLADLRAGRAEERADEVVALGRRLLADPLDPDGPAPRPTTAFDDPDDPARLVEELEASAMGVAWLLDRWGELGEALGPGRGWTEPERLRAIRLLGRRPTVADVGDEGAIAIPRACGCGEAFPSDAAAEPTGIVAEEEARLEGLLEEYLAHPEDVGGGMPEFDDSIAGERLRRYQASCDRSLLRVLETLRKRRQEREKLLASLVQGAPGSGASAPARKRVQAELDAMVTKRAADAFRMVREADEAKRRSRPAEPSAPMPAPAPPMPPPPRRRRRPRPRRTNPTRRPSRSRSRRTNPTRRPSRSRSRRTNPTRVGSTRRVPGERRATAPCPGAKTGD